MVSRLLLIYAVVELAVDLRAGVRRSGGAGPCWCCWPRSCSGGACWPRWRGRSSFATARAAALRPDGTARCAQRRRTGQRWPAVWSCSRVGHHGAGAVAAGAAGTGRRAARLDRHRAAQFAARMPHGQLPELSPTSVSGYRRWPRLHRRRGHRRPRVEPPHCRGSRRRLGPARTSTDCLALPRVVLPCEHDRSRCW